MHLYHDSSRSGRDSEAPATCFAEAHRKSFAADVLQGLAQPNKSLPCKYLYDQRGSQLFDQICELEEYYPTRIETQIMRDNAGAIGEHIGTDAIVVEYGSGSSIKTRVLLDHLDAPLAYMPVDISEEHLLQVARGLTEDYPDLVIHPVVADFTEPFGLPESYAGEPLCVYFPGSTIGNLEPSQATLLLRQIASQCGREGKLLIGIDLDKSPQMLLAAYDDSQGVTAAFSLNLLRRINRELAADFDLEQFRHVAVYNSVDTRIEIYIESLAAQQVQVSGESFWLNRGERIFTEYSHKYRIDQFIQMGLEANWHAEQVWTDTDELFAVMLLKTLRPLDYPG